MIIYLVIACYMGDERVEGVYSTPDKAREKVRQLELKWGDKPFETRIDIWHVDEDGKDWLI
jgi:hypothetical protein